MSRRLLSAAFLALALLSPTPQANATRAHSHANLETQNCVVYVTRTGHRYHRVGCRYLKGGARVLQRDEALKRGFTPCRVCGGSDCE